MSQEGGKMAKLYFYYSAMNAGKTTSLLQSNYNYKERGMNTLLLSPEIDKRSGSGKIVSRIGLEAKSQPFGTNADLASLVVYTHEMNEIDCVLVDEAQFLTPIQVLQLTKVCDTLSIPVLCYGIRTDFRGELFEGSKYLLAWADNLIELKTICPTGAKATMNARLDQDGNRIWEGDQVSVGMNYISLSRKEFQLEKVSPVAQMKRE